MFSIDLFRDLYTHMEWADALIWKAAFATENALSDTTLRERLFHVHLTQRVFFQVWTNETVEIRKAHDFPTLPALYSWVQPYYRELDEFLAGVTAAQLTTPAPVPWAHYFARRIGKEVEVTTLEETMYQVASHSTHHRAQNNLRLRELGATPPLVDYIGWVWAGRPGPEWPVMVDVGDADNADR